MIKSEKIKNNEMVNKAYNVAIQEYLNTPEHKKIETRLRTCTAYVIETENYYFLRSYKTMIAFIEKSTDTCYDVLRLVYGYTSTSAQHIAKFRRDYGCGKWGCVNEYRYIV